MDTFSQDQSPRNSENADAILIAEWSIKRGELARVFIEKYKGSWLISLRKWFEVDGGELRPTGKGIAISVKHVQRIALAMDEAVAFARERGLIPPPTGQESGQ